MLEFTLFTGRWDLAASRLLLVGAGKRENFSGAVARKVIGAAVRYLKTRSIKNFAILARDKDRTEDLCKRWPRRWWSPTLSRTSTRPIRRADKSIENVVMAGFRDAEKGAGGQGLERRAAPLGKRRTLRATW